MAFVKEQEVDVFECELPIRAELDGRIMTGASGGDFMSGKPADSIGRRAIGIDFLSVYLINLRELQ